MNRGAQDYNRWLIRSLMAMLSLPLPAILLWLSVHEPGINLSSALSTNISWQTYQQLFQVDTDTIKLFWSSLERSIFYSTLASLIVLTFAGSFVLATAFSPTRWAVRIAYSLLGLALLPQTFLVLAVLQIAAELTTATASAPVIILTLTATLVPFACWASWLLVASNIREFLSQLAADGVPIRSSAAILLRSQIVPATQIFLVLFASAMGNFVVPFALGDNSTYTSLVFLQGLNSNLGRDWASVAAAGLLTLIPAIVAAILVVSANRRN